MKRTALIIMALAATVAVRGSVQFSCSITDERRKTVEITEIRSEDQEFIEIPRELLVDGQRYRVTGIAEYSLKRCKKVRDVYVPETVLSIAPVRHQWVSDCPELITIRWKDIIYRFGLYKGEKTDDLIHPYIIDEKESTCGIGYSPEYKLKELTIPEKLYFDGRTWKVVAVAPGAFRYNKFLESVYIPETVTYVGECAFFDCPHLRTVYANGEWQDVTKHDMTLGDAYNYVAGLTGEAFDLLTGGTSDSTSSSAAAKDHVSSGKIILWILIILVLCSGKSKKRSYSGKKESRNFHHYRKKKQQVLYRGWDGVLYNSRADRDYYDKIRL